MTRLFISHATADIAKVIAFGKWLELNGWDDYFFDSDPERGIAAGERWQQQLKLQIDRCEAVLFLISRAWLRSRWCLRELDLATDRDKRLFGVLIDDAPYIDLPPVLTQEWQLLNIAPVGDVETFSVHPPDGSTQVEVKFSKEGLEKLKRGLEKAELEARSFVWPVNDPDRSPYRGLLPLEAEDAGIFFGRDAEIARALDQLRSLESRSGGQIFAILGSSGAGKSSFLRAGLLPRLMRDDRYFTVLPVLRLENSALWGPHGLLESIHRAFQRLECPRSRQELRQAIANCFPLLPPDTLNAGGPQSLIERTRGAVDALACPQGHSELHQEMESSTDFLAIIDALISRERSRKTTEGVSSQRPTLIIAVDQGEELFGPESGLDSSRFLMIMTKLLTFAHDAILIISIRSDTYDVLQCTPELTGIRQELFSLSPMPRAAYKEVIEGPANRLHGTRKLKVDPKLTEALLAEIDEGTGRGSLPLLAFTLERLFLEYGGSKELRLTDYRDMGGLTGAIQAAVTRALNTISTDPESTERSDALLRRGFIPWLVTIDEDATHDRRRVARWDEIPEASRPLMEQLVEKRLLVRDRHDGIVTLEPAHESLLWCWHELKQWIDEDRSALRALAGLRRAANEWDAHQRNADWLTHRGSRLQEVNALSAGRPDLTTTMNLTDLAYLSACEFTDEITVSVDVKSAILAKLTLVVGKDAGVATRRDWYRAAALALRDRIVHRWLITDKQSYDAGRKWVYYLSLEFLIGRLFTDALNNMGLLPVFEAALGDLGVGLADLSKCEPDAALGNGGLGRLAACFMESMSTLAIPAIGYGIRYDFGLFRQIISHGWQQEYPDEWLGFGNPWEFQRPEVVYHVHFGGSVEHMTDAKGRDRAIWHPAETVQAVAYDTPIVGWRGQHVNALRLWSARAPDPLRLDVFNTGDYLGASAEQARAESICKFLYPNDESAAGRELRLRQEYFFVSASLQDLIKRHLASEGQLRGLAQKAAVQLNDSHPSLAVTELMRILVDLHNFRWDEAWQITTAVLSYTNHTILPEALETWPLELFERMLPRHLDIIYRINHAHLALADARCPGDGAFRASVSLIDEKSGRQVRMGQLAFVGSHRINGVSAMHSDLMKETVFHDLNHLYPGRITNKTNGITFRRWLMLANPGLTGLLREVCGEAVLDDPSLLARLEPLAGNNAFQQQFRAIKHRNKIALARLIGERLGIQIDPDALYDVQIKRIHEYKRQLLNLLETVALYHAIRDEPRRDWVPRVKIFAGKAAASDRYAKLITKLINDVAEVVNSDPVIGGKLKVAFLQDYNVSLAEVIIPAADLSEQISTAGMEASGTGNMKLALNGALTIGTLDGANLDIRDHVGPDNIFILGLVAREVEERRRQGLDASAVIAASPHLSRAIAAIASGAFSPDDPSRFESIAHALCYLDHYMVSADFDAYFATQRNVDELWLSSSDWTRMSILNTARMGWFSSDRAVREYAADIWNVPINELAKLS